MLVWYILTSQNSYDILQIYRVPGPYVSPILCLIPRQNKHDDSKRFYQLFADKSKDLCTRNYTRIMARFDDASPSKMLFNQDVGVGGMQLHVHRGRTIRPACIYCLHCPTRFLASLDGHISAWDNFKLCLLWQNGTRACYQCTHAKHSI
jgi:hypothetical protein